MSWVGAVFILLAAQMVSVQAVDGAGERDRQAAFALRVSESGKHLEDAAGRPFLVHGDTAWSLVAELTREETELYLADRRKRGFNAILVNLLEHRFATHAPANAYREPPFRGAAAFTDMNEPYFEHAAWVVKRAEELGFVVFLAPAYLGVNGGDQGWYRQARQAGPEALRDYGAYVAWHFAGRRNIVWTHGGDFDAPDKALVRAIVSGIENAAPGSMHTVHSTLDTNTADYWAGEEWLALDTVYTYADTHAAVRARRPAMPVLMIEGFYEEEHGADAEMLRRQAYGAMLAGAAGHIYGNNPIWHFSGPGLHAAEKTWREALASPGAESMAHFRMFFEGLEWWRIAPDTPRLPLETGEGGYLAAASDRSFALAYLFEATSVMLDSEETAGRQPEVRWFDPSNGRWYAPSAKTDRAGARRVFFPPATRNAAGDRDWVFLVRFTK